MKKIVLGMSPVLIAIAVLVLDPIGFWRFQFDDADMRRAVEGTWQLTLTSQDDSRTWRFTIAQRGRAEHASRGLVRSADACGKRSFVRTAGACLEMSRMPLELALVDGPRTDVRGELTVTGLTFEAGALELQVGDVYVDASIGPDGTVRRAEARDLRVALVRTAPAAATVTAPR